MQLAPHVEALLGDVAEIAAVGDESTAEAAQSAQSEQYVPIVLLKLR